MNNAMWCDLVCRLHGRPGNFTDALWTNAQPAPPFYPNAVTLNASDASVRAALEVLATQLTGSSWAVKDSLDRLDLSGAGFRRLFRAEWIVRPVDLPLPEMQKSDVRWARVERADQLDQWEQVWRRAGNDLQDPAWQRIFPPTLLAESDVRVLAGCRGDRIVAGAIANLAAGYAGLTNIFADDANSAATIADLVRVVAALFPDVPIGGYESDERLRLMRSLGFSPAGPLAVWLKSAGDP